MDFIAKPGWRGLAEAMSSPAEPAFQARPAHKGESGKPVTAHCRVSLVLTHLHAQKEVRVEAAAGSLTSWE